MEIQKNIMTSQISDFIYLQNQTIDGAHVAFRVIKANAKLKKLIISMETFHQKTMETDNKN